MSYVKLDENNVVMQKDIEAKDGFEEAPDHVVCGQIKQEDGSFVNPPIVEKTWEQQMLETGIDDDLENVIDALEPPTRARIASETIDKYNAKKTLRGQRPGG